MAKPQDKILETFYLNGNLIVRTENIFTKNGRRIGEQEYKDHKQYKKHRIENNWDKPVEWID